MNVKSLLLLLAFTGFGVSCNSDDPDGPGTGGIAGRTELQIAFSGTGESVEYDTKATASEKENHIDKLEIYLFAAATADADVSKCYFLEKWTDGTAYDPAHPTATNFKKTENGTGHKASLYPNELKGLPYVKLYCVANNGAALQTTTDGKFYKESGATADEILATMLPVTVAGDGTITPGTTEEDFKKSFTMALTLDANGIIKTPLLMTGTGATKISGSVSKVDIVLKRNVARFDIENNVTRSNLTITSVTLAQGRKTGALWDAKPTEEVKANLFTYQPIDFTTLTGANQGVCESAFYAYPNLDTDESYLILSGTFKSPSSSEQVQVPVTYNVPIQKAVAPDATPGTEGAYIVLKANSRYRLNISNVTQSNVYGTFEVVDWTSGGGIVVKPDNDAPVFTGKAAFSAAAGQEKFIPKKLPDGTATGDTCNYEVVEAAGGFSIEIAATGAVRAELGVVTKAGIPTWLTKGTPTSKEKDGVWYTKFDFTYTEAIGQEPVAVTFINDAASYDPALWTTINFYGPKAVPGFTVVTDGNSKGNLTAVDGTTKAPTASLYRVAGSYVTFDIASIEGVTPGTLAGYKIEKVKTEGSTHTYKVSVTAATAADGTIEFANTGDPTKKTTLTLTALDPSLKFTKVTDAQNIGDYTNGSETPFPTTGKLQINLDDLSGSYVFKIEAPQGVTATNMDGCAWLTITESKAWANGSAEYTIVKKTGTPANTTNYVLKFANALSEADKSIAAPDYSLTLNKAYSKPKITPNTDPVTYANSIFNDATAAGYPYAVTASMYKVVGSKIYLSIACTEAMTVTSDAANVSVAKQGATNICEIKVTDVSSVGNTVTITAKNDNDENRKATIAITMLDPAITVDTPVGSTITGTTVTVPSTYAAYSQSTFTVKGRKGSTITFDATAWYTHIGAPTVIGDNGTAVITLMGADPMPGTTADGTITVHNAVTDADETITITKAAP